MRRNDRKGGADEGDAVRHHLATSENRRFLRNLPAFRLPADMPDMMQDLLERLDQTESGLRSR